jgi:Tfp pilus assembly protein PilE
MPSPERSGGFTLLELLVAVSLAMVLMGLAWTGFVQLRKMAATNQALIGLAQEAGYLQRRFEADIGGTMQQVQWRLETTVLDAAIYGTERAVRLIGMVEVPELVTDQDVTFNPEDRYEHAAIWYCWEWRPPTLAERADYPEAPGSLWYVRSQGNRGGWMGNTTASVRGGTPGAPPAGAGGRATYSMVFQQVAQPRRSRKRDLDDNDYRLMEGGDLAGVPRLRGDRGDLLGGGGAPVRLRPVSMRVSGFSLAWVDYQGRVTQADHAGLTVVDAAGNAVAHPGQTWWNADQRVVDGLYRDGRTPSGGTPPLDDDPLRHRPGLVRLSFTLVDREARTERAFHFSITPDLAVPLATGL